MIADDDPRHGTSAGYNAGCHDACCREALAAWSRKARARRYLYGPLTVPSLGTVRRIHALMALGWSTRALDARLGKKRTYTNAVLLGGDELHATTAGMYARLYERLSMQLPPQRTHQERQIASRTRNYARKMGWAPPLAWDDPDDPNETPAGTWRPSLDDEYDEAVVVRLLAGEHIESRRADRDEAMRRWKAAGNSEKSLCERLGWKAGRYDRERRAS